jgi:uncharacterized protein YkwD
MGARHASADHAGMRSRILPALAVAALAVAPSVGSARSIGTTTREPQLQTSLLAEINGFRAAHGLTRLRVSRSLAAAAAFHSLEMARGGFFSHDSADGSSFSQRIGRFYAARGFRRWSVGENLVWGGPDLSAGQAFHLWLASPPHRANLLTPRWREIGLAAVHSTDAPGVYGGPATIVTADLGQRYR